MIDKSSPLPIYYQIEEQIKQQIVSGILEPGDMLRSEREYAEYYQVSRMTVRQAINNLVALGLIYKKKGSGTFVQEQKIEQALHGLTSFTEDMKTRGLEPSSHLIDFKIVPASQGIATELKIKEHTPVYEIKRIRLGDDVPIAIETNIIPANLVLGLTEEIVINSLYNYIENKLHLRIGNATQIIESATANKTEAELLEIEKQSPILLIERKTYLTDGTPLEIVKSSYRGDRYKFMININRT
ncbi:GntR family transcriptional regulator [Alkalihalobacillus alcalophilus ATCC 27647 = CGMCC 1.3604]|uniref:GntR family transcriptional regulator n=1 Tax=Alkalihalobacillus alcalophilus ATCC 27647 = CGMCC 1.3604 TaxID=1218173 RepID=A0A094XFV3_ALKAL|nr:GntR family transcriptional regulator [Alkalihalobacillus alcalophilus]KGA97670.1 GntR family transcriptional regulator [Alkalihalobacillus alcalophilus ATCC 27647 = CGMCC 1.3604]MED1561296.1 GntR family transcriptional regulator [Alkalihalobacillus alcalophilus]THG90348.1 GntR family transcriptional regulator [Alkalihalobacillus alcalophilus ATCC 27647 = CGMCC 1.3604]